MIMVQLMCLSLEVKTVPGIKIAVIVDSNCKQEK